MKPIVVQHDPIHKRIEAVQKAYHAEAGAAKIAYWLNEEKGTLFHDGVYRPSRDDAPLFMPVFDAKMTADELGNGRYSHWGIELLALKGTKAADFNPYEIAMVYYGNWLRDWSQLCDGFMLPPDRKGKVLGLSREKLTTAVMLFGQIIASTLFRKDEQQFWEQAKPFVQFYEKKLPACMKLLGCYRPEEHMDNPAGLPDHRDGNYPKDWLVPLPIDKKILQVDPQTHIRRYIADPGLTSHWPSSLVYMQRQLKEAARLGKTAEGLVHFGFAMHILEDWYAHTNFVELWLIKLGYTKVVAWVPYKPNLADMPVTTGQFGTSDMLFSLLYKIGDLAFPPSETGKRLPKVVYEGLEAPDWFIWAVLHDTGLTTEAQAFKLVAQAQYKIKDVIEDAVPDAVKKKYDYWRGKVYAILADAVKKLAGAKIRNPQIESYDFEHSIDPTHTMIAKDGQDHPLHGIAANLAIDAVRNVGQAMQYVWAGKITVEQLVSLASRYFVHPYQDRNTDTEKTIREWTRKNPLAITKASDQKAAMERSKHHHHDHGHAHDYTYPPKSSFRSFLKNNQRAKDMWAFVTENHEALYAKADALPEDLA